MNSPPKHRITLAAAATALAGLLPGVCTAQLMDRDEEIRRERTDFIEQTYPQREVITRPLYYGTAGSGRGSMTGWRAFRATRAREAAPQTTKVGPVAVGITTGMQVEFNDNINLSENNPLADIILRPLINLRLDWPVTRANRLNVNLGLQYQHYLFNDDYNRSNVLITPGTVIDFRVFAGDFVFTIYDAPEIRSAPGEDSPFGNIVDFRMLNNTAGVSVLWDLNRLFSIVGFERQDQLSLNQDFRSQDYHQYNAYAGTFYSITPALTAGMRGLVSRRYFREPVLNDFWLYQGGLVLQAQLTRYTAFYGEVGIQYFDFQPTGTPANGGPVFATSDGVTTDVAATAGGGNFLGPYFRFGLSNRLNRFIAHGLDFSSESQGASIANFNESFRISYELNWAVNRNILLRTTLAYERGVFSGEDTGRFQNYEAGAGASYNILRNLSLSLNYAFINRIGTDNVASYMQNRVWVGVGYSF